MVAGVSPTGAASPPKERANPLPGVDPERDKERQERELLGHAEREGFEVASVSLETLSSIGKAKGKRDNGEGSISRRKNGGWMAQYVIYTARGRKRRTIYGKTRKEVAGKLATALSDREKGMVFEAGTLTVEEYLERWLRECVRDTVKASTYSSYEQLLNLHTIPTLGRIRLKTLTATHVRSEKFVSTILQKDPNSK